MDVRERDVTTCRPVSGRHDARRVAWREADVTASPAGDARTSPSLVEPPRDALRESEKGGLVVATLARERYRSILELGCGAGALGASLRERCARYTGLDTDLTALAEARTRVVDARFARLSAPLALPPGDHELVVLSEIVHRLDGRSLARLTHALEAHRACTEIVVVGPCAADAAEPDGEPTLRALVDTLGAAFAHDERALRRRYRIDALIRR